MRRVYGSAVAVAAIALVPQITLAQADAARAVAGGGISVAGWTGKADGTGSVSETKLAKEGDALHAITGPAITYWNPANKASGNYTVKATFKEPKFMGLNDHPHPYGIMIAGNDLGTDQQSYLYCAANGNGSFIVRGFAPNTPRGTFMMNGGRGEMNASVHKAAGPGEPVTQEIAVSVKGDKVECAINGTTVATYEKSAIVTAGKLKSTDGIYGIRMAHNTEAIITGFSMTKQ